jgi:MoaA/NifB/PqqE/SkfB family radical SAM enzyme
MRIVIELTNRCNLACRHCFSGRHGGNDDLPLRVIDNILEGAAGLGFTHLTFTGGDPTVYKHFSDLLARVAEAGYRFSFVTNGYNFASSHKTVLPYRESLEQITFSLDGATRETHGALRGPRSWDKVLEAMHLARSLELPFSNNMVVTRHNRFELRAMIQLVQGLGSSGLRFGHLLHSPLTTAQGFDLSPAERLEVEQEIWALQRDYIFPIAMAPGFSTDDPLPCAPLHLQEVNIDCQGRLTKCCHLSSHGPDVGQSDVACDLNKTPFREGFLKLFLQNERFKRDKAAHLRERAREADRSPCWYCQNHFKKVDWLQNFPDNPWTPHLWEEGKPVLTL